MMSAATISNLITSLSLNPQKTHLQKPTITSLNPFTTTTTTTTIQITSNIVLKYPCLSQSQHSININNNSSNNKVGANIMYFKSGYNMQLAVEERWTEKELIDTFNRLTARFGIKRECYRRRFFENPRDKSIRKLRDSIRRRQKRPSNRDDKHEEKKKVEVDGDNWELPDEELPEHDYLLRISKTSNRWDNDERTRTSNFESNDSTLPLGAFGNKKKGKWNK